MNTASFIKTKEANLSKENSNNSLKESLDNNLSQSNVEENKGQATFVIEVNCDMKEVAEQPTSTIMTTEQKRGGFKCFLPLCYHNSKVKKVLSFYVIWKEPVLSQKKVVACDMQEKLSSNFWSSGH